MQNNERFFKHDIEKTISWKKLGYSRETSFMAYVFSLDSYLHIESINQVCSSEETSIPLRLVKS